MRSAASELVSTRGFVRRHLPLAGAFVLGVLAFGIAFGGYGAFFHAGLPLLVVGIVVVQLQRLKEEPSIGVYLYRVLVLVAATYGGGTAGSAARRLHSLPVRGLCERVSELLERSKLDSGEYPDGLGSIPELVADADLRNLRIVQGRFAKQGDIFIDLVDDYSGRPRLYLSPERYLWLVPIERPLPISFTRFHAYLKGNGDAGWRYEDIGWHWALTN